MFILYVFFTLIRFCNASGGAAVGCVMRGFSAYLMRSANHVTVRVGVSQHHVVCLW